MPSMLTMWMRVDGVRANGTCAVERYHDGRDLERIPAQQRDRRAVRAEERRRVPENERQHAIEERPVGGQPVHQRRVEMSVAGVERAPTARGRAD